jgi:antirestriction protein
MATLPQMKSFLTRASKKSDASEGLKRIANALKNFRQLDKGDQKDLNDLVRSAYAKLKSKPKATSTPKKATPKKTDSFATDLDKFKKKVGKVIFRRATSGTDIDKDAKRPALKSGKRIVRKQGYTSNQYGTFENKVGTPYWESRSNRMDVNQPSQRARVKLADGGSLGNIGDPFSFDVKAKNKNGENVERTMVSYSSNEKMAKEKLLDFLTQKLKYTDVKISNGRKGHHPFAKGGKVGKSYTYGNEGYSYTNNFGVDQADFIKLVDVYHNTYPLRQTDRIVERLTYREFASKYGEEKLHKVMNYIHQTHKIHEGRYAKGGSVSKGIEQPSYEEGIMISKPFYSEEKSFFGLAKGYKITNKFKENITAEFIISKNLGISKKDALDKANAFYNFCKKAKTWEQYEDLSSEFIKEWNAKEKYAKGGKLSSRARYIPNRNIEEVEVNQNGKTRFIDGADILDGFYLKKKGKFAEGGELDEAKIYVADLMEYNNGKLVGKWLNLSDYSSGSEVLEAIQEFLDEQTKKDKYGEVHEEYAIHDYEGFPRSFYSEYMGEGDFDNLYEIMRIADSSNLPVDVLMEAMSDLGYEDNAERVAEAYYSSIPASMGNEFRDFAYEYIDSIGSITDAVSNPEFYFDYESFGSDVRMDYTEEELEEMGYNELDDAELGETLVDEQGGVKNLGQKTIEMYFDYDKFGRDLEYDFIAVRGKDGDYYFFNRNFAKGGEVEISIEEKKKSLRGNPTLKF